MTQARLRDMEAHLDQYGPQLVRSEDGRLCLAWGALLPSQVDVEPFPHNTPQLRLSPLLGENESIDFNNGAALRRIEQKLDDFGIQPLIDGADGSHSIARANPVIHQRRHDLQVVWLGSRRQWLVMEGGIAWKEYDNVSEVTTPKSQVYERTPLDGVSGWIVLRALVQPLPSDTRINPSSNGYTLTPAGFDIQLNPVNNPPRRSLTSGEISPGIYWNRVDWSLGRMLFPAAYVEVPGRNGRLSPRIHQVALGSWSVSTFDSTPVWATTLPRSSFTTLSSS